MPSLRPNPTPPTKYPQPHLRNTHNPTCKTPTTLPEIPLPTPTISNPNPEEKTYKAWSKEKVEKLIGWMEENQEVLQGLQRKWHKDIKEEVFADDENIIFNRIRDKVLNIKAAWSQAKKARDQSSWSLKPEDYSDSQ
ncbi:hypothetical protein BGX38DRAFT_1144655 [Terfezia claveryi]|nr:hypothetical protein BGX38DRAFT_1144655 [Terfezia claveryi]